MPQTTSFIICSITESKIEAVTQRIHACVSEPHEVIVIRDAKSLCEGYTRGLQQATGEVLVFCHDDIDFLCDAQLLPRLNRHLATYDVVGVAGSSRLAGPFWMSGGPGTWAGMVIHHKPQGTYDITLYEPSANSIQPVQALDGVFLAMRREVAEQIGFDAETFDGFHAYDIDFTYRCYKAGLRLGACKDLFLVHESGGNFGNEWRTYGERFIKKHEEFANTPLDLCIRYSPCAIVARSEDETRILCQEILEGYIDPAAHRGDLPGPTSSNRDYTFWAARKSLQEIDGQLLAERMMKDWRTQPKINVLIEVQHGEEHLLADSIDALAAQWYGDWHLTIVADFPPFSEEFASYEQITWVTKSGGDFASELASVLSQQQWDWLCLLEVGTTIEAHGLAYFADNINLQPQAKLIYCDEDIRGIDEEKNHSPRFKPHFNLEFLRSTYYFGPILLVDRTAYELTGGLQQTGTMGYYDLSLKLFECYGRKAFEHLPEILVHTPATPLREMDATGELDVLRLHLSRLNIEAEVAGGFLQGTQTVRYLPPQQPLVSIIIASNDQPGYLVHCVESLLSETRYRHFELLIVDHATSDPDALDYLTDLPAHAAEAGIKAACLRAEGTFNYARLANQGANAASGELLLFLDNDTEIIQPEWLDWLVGYAMQPGVAAVAPRLSCPDDKLSILNGMPNILGLGGLAGQAADADSNIISPGYCGRLQIAQDSSALNGSCFMVKASEFKLLNGFDESNTPVYEPTLELCLRLGQREQRLIWTPWVDIAHRGGITRKKREADPNDRGWLTESALKEQDFLLGKYLPQLANDPNYHRQLSLQQPFAIEPHAVIDWDTRFHNRLRVLGAPLTSASGQYRMTSPFRAMQKAGLAQCCIIHPPGHQLQRVINPIELARAAPDTLMLQQAIDDVQISQLKRYRRFNEGLFITYAVDDILGNLPKKHYLHNYQAREGRSRMREGLSYCDRLIVSTEPLAEYCRSMIDDIVVIPNRLEKTRWLGHESQRNAAKKPRVGWAGAQQHLGDLELIKDVVEALSDEVEWVFMGMCPAFLKPFIAEEHAFVSFADYPAKLASLNLDLAIAPLEQHLFNEGKSNLRLLEYGIMGWPVICTDIYPYQTNNAPVLRLKNEASLWINAIRERIHDLEAAYREGDQLKEWVVKHYLLEDHLEDWLQAVTPTSQ